jgi:aquaporin Z
VSDRLSDEPRRGPSPEASLGARLLAEFGGTFALTMASAGAAAVSAFAGGALSHGERAAAGGLMVVALIYATGDLSGAHVNPAVTIAFALRRVFHARLVLPYCAAQCAGAIVAASVLRALFGLAGHVGAPQSSYGALPALALEAIFSFLLVAVVLNTSSRHKVVGPNAAIGVGAVVMTAHMVAEPVSGAALNPARALGPALLAGELGRTWIYVVGPVFGACCAVVLTTVLRGEPHDGERIAAEGKDHGDP